MSAATTRLGLVGCGRIAEAGYLPALARVPGLELAAVADRDASRREHLARLAGGVRAHDSLAGLLHGGAVDAVVLATPAAAHLPDARLAADRGVRTLVEKPPAPDAPTAAALARLRPAPRVGFNRRFDPSVARMRAALGRAGAVQLRLDLRYRRASWRSHEAADDALLDLGPHLVDLARRLSASAVLEVRCAVARPARAELELELERGRAELVCATDRPWRELLEARDDRGRVVARHRVGGVVALAGRVLPRGHDRMAAGGVDGGHPLVGSLAMELEAFVRSIHGERVPDLATAEDGVAVMAAIDAARRSAERRGRPERPATPRVAPGDPQPEPEPESPEFESAGTGADRQEDRNSATRQGAGRRP